MTSNYEERPRRRRVRPYKPFDPTRLAVRTYKPVVPTPPVLGIGPQKFWYAYGYTLKGKAVNLGPFMDVQSANSSLETLMDGELFELETRDLSRASRIIKATLLERTRDADTSIQRMKHSLKDDEKVQGKRKYKENKNVYTHA